MPIVDKYLGTQGLSSRLHFVRRKWTLKKGAGGNSNKYSCTDTNGNTFSNLKVSSPSFISPADWIWPEEDVSEQWEEESAE